jgi:hypothetical protein
MSEQVRLPFMNEIEARQVALKDQVVATYLENQARILAEYLSEFYDQNSEEWEFSNVRVEDLSDQAIVNELDLMPKVISERRATWTRPDGSSVAGWRVLILAQQYCEWREREKDDDGDRGLPGWDANASIHVLYITAQNPGSLDQAVMLDIDDMREKCENKELNIYPKRQDIGDEIFYEKT